MKRPEGFDKAQSDKAIFEYYSHFDPSCIALEHWLGLCRQQFGSFGPARRIIEETANAIEDYYKCYILSFYPLPQFNIFYCLRLFLIISFLFDICFFTFSV